MTDAALRRSRRLPRLSVRVPRAARAPRRITRAAAWLGRGIRPLRIVTALGWSALAVGAVSLVVALAGDWVEFLAIAAVALAAVLLAIPFVLGRTALAVRVELVSPRVVVGEPAVGRVAVRNVAQRTSGALRIELPVGRVRAAFRVPRMATGEEHDELFTIPTHRRAILRLGPVESVRSDPAGLLRREVSWTDPSELYVHPRVVSLSADTTGFLRDLEGLPTRDLADDDVSFHALREYTPGDDLRHVHWKSTARTGTLMIRQFEQTRRSHLLLVLSTRTADYRDAEEFELAVSMTGSIGVSALRAGKAVSVLTSTGRLPAPTATQLLDRLSGVEQGTAHDGLEAPARTAFRAAPAASVVVFLTGSETPLAEIRAASLRVPVTARSMCVRAASGEDLARRSVGDVATVSVPDLGSLHAAMRAVTA